jgi:hypothetical protein
MAANGRILDIAKNVLQFFFQTGISSSQSYFQIFILIALLEPLTFSLLMSYIYIYIWTRFFTGDFAS